MPAVGDITAHKSYECISAPRTTSRVPQRTNLDTFFLSYTFGSIFDKEPKNAVHSAHHLRVDIALWKFLGNEALFDPVIDRRCAGHWARCIDMTAHSAQEGREVAFVQSFFTKVTKQNFFAWGKIVQRSPGL
jgi:hypothetical protein